MCSVFFVLIVFFQLGVALGAESAEDLFAKASDLYRSGKNELAGSNEINIDKMVSFFFFFFFFFSAEWNRKQLQ